MLKLENISKYYYSDNTVNLGLRKINLSFEKGEFVAITGESGSGKSTLLNVISGMDTYEEGEIFVNGAPTSGFDAKDWEIYRRDHIGFIYQNYNLIDSYNVLENVMSALLVQGYDEQEARNKAAELIDKVGLADRIRNRASKLSSGQKQRLSIARALAKDTDIIVADEPTGNLDSESGEQVIKLLSELSKERLVLIVTHNYKQVSDYITRKVKLFDGEVIEDKKIKPKNKIEKKNEIATSVSPNWKTARAFAKMNFRAQPKRIISLLLIFCFMAFASFVLLGMVFKNSDPTIGYKFDNAAFKNGDEKRIVVKRLDDENITDEDVRFFESIRNVTSVEKDYCTDINYYTNRDITINFIYQDQTVSGPFVPPYKVNTLTDGSHFIKTSASLNNAIFLEGRTVKLKYDIVVTEAYGVAIDDTMELCITMLDRWDKSTYAMMTFNVVGIIEGDEKQIYFSEEFADDIAMSGESINIGFGMVFIMDNNEYHFTSRGSRAVRNESLPENTVKINDILYNTVMANLNIIRYDLTIGTEQLNVNVLEKRSGNNNVLELSADIFDKYYSVPEYKQATVYISDYTKCDSVLAKLEKAGYRAVSPYRVGCIKASSEEISEKNLTICYSIGILAGIYLVGIVAMKFIISFKKGDYLILRSLGMNNKTVWIVNIIETFVYCLAGMLIAGLLVLVALIQPTGILLEIATFVKYYHFGQIALIVLINLVVGQIIGLAANVVFDKNVNITALN